MRLRSWNLFLESSPDDPAAKVKNQWHPGPHRVARLYYTEVGIFKDLWGTGSWPMRSVCLKENNCNVSVHRTSPSPPGMARQERNHLQQHAGPTAFKLTTRPSSWYEILATWNPLCFSCHLVAQIRANSWAPVICNGGFHSSLQDKIARKKVNCIHKRLLW